jgi:3-hydroxyacyl-[acyl-carrier protein] dehydratase / trans-2-decenoyl-[acyl-carrier protein] isomerase
VTYAEFCSRRAFERDDLLRLAEGRLLDDAPSAFRSKLPTPPMLMIDRVTDISRQGTHRGRIVAERDVHPDDWYFQCHFVGDPVQPGCLGIDGIWQLLGFYCAWAGALGTGRAVGAGEIEFTGQILPNNRLVRYEVDIVRYTQLPASGATIVIGDGRLFVDGEAIYSMKRAKVGIFRNIEAISK